MSRASIARNGRVARRSARRRGATALVAMVALAVAAAGCTSFIPAYDRPTAPIAETYPLDNAPAVTADVAAADIEWQRFFTDARLKRLIEIALRQNRDLRIAVLNVEQARALYQIRRADRLPTLDAGLTAQRQPGLAGDVVSSYALGVQVTSYELDFFGRVRSLSQAALARYLATDEGRKNAQIALVAAVANTHVALLADDEQLRVTQEALRTREESLRLNKLKFDNGAASELDYRQAEQLLESARATLAQLERQRATDQNALVLLVGQPLPADAPAPSALSTAQTSTDLPAGLPSALLTRRPDIRAAEQQLLGANADIGAARAAFFPRIALTANAGVASTALSGLFKGGNFAFTGAASLLQPIFNAGRNRANLEATVAARDIAIAQYERAIQSAFREVADALAGRSTLGAQRRALAAQTNAAQITFRLADLRYRNGASSYLEVLDAQRALFDAQLATVRVQALQVQNLVTLYQVLGGGWSAPR